MGITIQTDPAEAARLRKERRAKLRKGALRALGGSCCCCDELHTEFLEVHHVNDNGNIERKTLGRKEETVLRHIANGKVEGYMLLCANCHRAITYHGNCPHGLRVIETCQPR